MKPVIFLPIASVLTLVHCVGHTVQGVLRGPTHGAEENAVIETMKSHAFNFGGFERNYWDFHLGYGWFLSVILFVLGLLFWYLVGLAETNPLAIRPILALFCFNFLAMAIVSRTFLALGPIIIELLIAASFAAAFLTTTARKA